MYFPVVLVNEPAGVWNGATNEVTISVSGYYYVELVGQNDSPGVIDMSLMAVYTTSLCRLLLIANAEWITRSRSAIVPVTANTKLTVAYNNVQLNGGMTENLS